MMATDSDRVPCPFCAEEILPGARKCKHCGEWLDSSVQAPQAPAISDTARAVSMGIKEQRRSEGDFSLRVVGAFLLACLVGYGVAPYLGILGLLLAVAGFLVAFVRLRRSYYHE